MCVLNILQGLEALVITTFGIKITAGKAVEEEKGQKAFSPQLIHSDDEKLFLERINTFLRFPTCHCPEMSQAEI